MRFNRLSAVAAAEALSEDELTLAIHVVCSAFNAQKFPGVATLEHVRQMVDVLDHERGRREKATAEHAVAAIAWSEPRRNGAF
jgi:hypothetical protein